MASFEFIQEIVLSSQFIKLLFICLLNSKMTECPTPFEEEEKAFQREREREQEREVNE